MKVTFTKIIMGFFFFISCSDNDTESIISDVITPSNSGIVTNPTTGKIWMDRNLGASNIASSITDASAYGSLYQWGRATDGHELRTSATTNSVSNTTTPGHSNFILGHDDWLSPQNNTLWQGASGTNNPCPTGFRIPTETEWKAEMESWSSNDAAGAFASVLKLTLGGARSRMSGAIGNVSAFAGYRSSSLNGLESRVLGISLNNALIGNRARGDGNSVRCIKD